MFAKIFAIFAIIICSVSAGIVISPFGTIIEAHIVNHSVGPRVPMPPQRVIPRQPYPGYYPYYQQVRPAPVW